MRLATQVSFATALISLLGSGLACLVAIFGFGVTPWILLACIPIGCACYLLSLTIAVFTSSSFSVLVKALRLYKSGNRSISFRINRGVKESEELSRFIDEGAKLIQTYEREILILKKREGEFISDVAHEFRTPLTAITGNAELMLDPDMPQDVREHFLELTLSETERLNNLVNSLISLRHIQEDPGSEIRRVDIRNIALDVVDTLYAIISKKNIHVTVEGEVPDILINPDRLKQALINLTDNACKHVEENGRVRIILFGVEDQSVIMVQDDGPGFGDIDPSLLFKRFYRTDFSRSRNLGGSGLGLPIVQAIVEGNDGSITAYNAPDGGAVFLAAFPSIVDPQ